MRKPRITIGKPATAMVPLVLVALLMTLTTGLSSGAPPPPSDPMGVVKIGVDHVLAVFNDPQLTLNERRAKLRTMSWQYFDFDDMAKSTLGYHWRELTSAQRQEFVPLFAEFIQDAFLSKLEQSTVKMVQQEARTARIQYLKQIYLSPDDAEVQTSVTVQDQRAPLAVDFKMFRSDGQWRVYDITIDAISIIANYRNQFDRVINQRGFDVLVADLKAKRQQLQEYMRSEAHAAANR